MFTYTTLFLVSFIVAVVGIFVLKVIVDTRKAVNKSKERVELIERPPTHQYEGAERAAASGIQFPPEDAGQGMSWSAAKSTFRIGVQAKPRVVVFFLTQRLQRLSNRMSQKNQLANLTKRPITAHSIVSTTKASNDFK
jgi:hypothetical protein